MSNKTKGILCILCSAFCWAFMGILVRMAGDVPSFQKSVFRNLVAMIMALILLLTSHEKVHLTKNDWKWLIIRATAGTIGLLANFYCIDRMMVADATILNKLSPFFAVIASVFLLREKLKPAQAGCILLAFAGALFVIKPGGSMPIGPALIGVCGGAGAGIAYSIVRKLRQRGVPGPFIVFFFSAFSCAAALPLVLPHYYHMETWQLLTLLGAGVFAALGQFAITAAYTFAPAREISVYDYSQIVFSALLGMLILHQIPDALSFLGYGIIICASVLMFLYNNRKNKGEEKTEKQYNS